MKIQHFCLVILTGMILAGTASAMEYEISSAQSNINFKVKHLGISTVTGKFDKFKGTYLFDAKDTTKSKVEVTIETNSINMKDGDLYKHLVSNEFFDTDKYPTAKFVSTKVTALKDGKFEAVGKLTLKGITKPVTLAVEYAGSVEDSFEGPRSGFTATTVLNRKTFGIDWSKTLDNGGMFVADDVKLEIEIEGVQKGWKRPTQPKK